MAKNQIFPLNTPFKHSKALITWFIVDFILFVLLTLSFMVVPVLIASDLEGFFVGISLAGVLILVVIFVAWVRLYYTSMWYELREDDMSWKRGVWFHRTGIVPYNRITNLDVIQGPVMRMLGISTLSIQTAGYSGQAVPEIRIEGIEHAEELRELIRSIVRQSGARDAGTGGTPSSPVSSDQKMIDELVKIRMLLEQQKNNNF
ncbi:MAG: PH domain-containing protein [Methanoregula sp.]